MTNQTMGKRNNVNCKQPIARKYFAKTGTCPDFNTFFDHGSHGFHTKTNNQHLIGTTWIKTPPQYHCDKLKEVDGDIQENYQRFCPHNPCVHNMKNSHELDDDKPILKSCARDDILHVLPCSKKRGVEALRQHDQQLHSKAIKFGGKHGLSNACGKHEDKHCQRERRLPSKECCNDNVAMKSANSNDTKQLLSHDLSQKNACRISNMIISTNSIPPNFKHPTSNQQIKNTTPKVSTCECNDGKGTTSTSSMFDVHPETHIEHVQTSYEDKDATIITKIKEAYVVYKNIQFEVVQAKRDKNKWFEILTNLITLVMKVDQNCELLHVDHITSFVNIDNKLKHKVDEARNVSLHTKSISPLTHMLTKANARLGKS